MTDFTQKIKLHSFDIHQEIQEILEINESDTCTVSSEKLRSWLKKAKAINIHTTRTVRGSHDLRIRHLTELALLRESSRLDIIDREASYSQTLSVLKEADNDVPCGVDRALRAVAKASSLLMAVSETDDACSFRNIQICSGTTLLKENEVLIHPDARMQPPPPLPALPHVEASAPQIEKPMVEPIDEPMDEFLPLFAQPARSK